MSDRRSRLRTRGPDPGARRRRFNAQGNYDAARRAFAAVPGVTGVRATNLGVARDQQDAPRRLGAGAPERLNIGFYRVDPDFFPAMGMRLLAGRLLGERFDATGSPAEIAAPDAAPPPPLQGSPSAGSTSSSTAARPCCSAIATRLGARPAGPRRHRRRGHGPLDHRRRRRGHADLHRPRGDRAAHLLLRPDHDQPGHAALPLERSPPQ